MRGRLKYQISVFKKISTNNSQSGAVIELEIPSFGLVGELILLIQLGVNFFQARNTRGFVGRFPYLVGVGR